MRKLQSGMVVLTVWAGFAAGCVTRGQDFSSDLRWIKVKQTTKTEVSQRLGEPFQIGSTSGQETWTYGRYNYKLFGDPKTKELKFYWTSDGKVESYSFNSSYPEDKKAGVGALSGGPAAGSAQPVTR